MSLNWMKKLRPEDPGRLNEFRDATQGLKWDEQHIGESLSQLFRAVDDLAQAEVNYYYRRRVTRAWISGITRSGAWSFGSIGLLLPLLASTANPEFEAWSPYGYVFLAAAASCLGANSLFGGTEGHIRFVSTQLEIEKLITKARVSWCRYLVSNGDKTQNLELGFSLIQDYADELHAATISETGHWGKTTKEALARYQENISSKKP